jgi:hypothetical protein
VKTEVKKTASLGQQDKYRTSTLSKTGIDASRYLPVTILINCRAGYDQGNLHAGYMKFMADALSRGHHAYL